MTLGHGTGDPTLEERADHAIAGFESSNPGTDADHFARAIRERNQVCALTGPPKYLPVTTI